MQCTFVQVCPQHQICPAGVIRGLLLFYTCNHRCLVRGHRQSACLTSLQHTFDTFHRTLISCRAGCTTCSRHMVNMCSVRVAKDLGDRTELHSVEHQFIPCTAVVFDGFQRRSETSDLKREQRKCVWRALENVLRWSSYTAGQRLTVDKCQRDSFSQ